MPYVWDPRLSLHSATIDRQHQDLFDCANEIEGMPKGPGHGPQVLAAFTRLIALMKINFDHEENLMSILAFAERGAHRGEHARILAEMAAFTDAVAASPDRLRFVDIFIKQWLPQHIVQQDLRLLTSIRHALGE